MKPAPIAAMLHAAFEDNDFVLSKIRSVFDARDFKNIAYAMQDAPEGDFLVFDNLGGKPFDVWTEREYTDMGAFVESMMKTQKPCVFAYQLAGKQTIVRVLESPKQRHDRSVKETNELIRKLGRGKNNNFIGGKLTAGKYNQ